MAAINPGAPLWGSQSPEQQLHQQLHQQQLQLQQRQLQQQQQLQQYLNQTAQHTHDYIGQHHNHHHRLHHHHHNPQQLRQPAHINLPSSDQMPLSNNANNGSSTKTGGKRKRVRTIFTTEQLKRLEQEFASQMYLVGEHRTLLAGSLMLTEAQVKVWFQNRRIKYRKAQATTNGNHHLRKVDHHSDSHSE